MTYKGARGAVPTRDGVVMNMLVALTRTGQVQVVVNIPVTPFRRAVPGGNRGGCESNWGSVMSYRHKFINFVVGKPGGGKSGFGE